MYGLGFPKSRQGGLFGVDPTKAVRMVGGDSLELPTSTV